MRWKEVISSLFIIMFSSGLISLPCQGQEVASIEDYVKVHLRILVVQNESEAKAIISRLEKGESFSELVKEKSIGPNREEGGDIGEFFLNDLNDFKTALQGVEEGKYSKVFQSGSKFVILYLVKKGIDENEKEEWEKAKKIDTYEAYCNFREKNPKSKLILRVNKKIIKDALIKIAMEAANGDKNKITEVSKLEDRVDLQLPGLQLAPGASFVIPSCIGTTVGSYKFYSDPSAPMGITGDLLGNARLFVRARGVIVGEGKIYLVWWE